MHVNKPIGIAAVISLRLFSHALIILIFSFVGLDLLEGIFIFFL